MNVTSKRLIATLALVSAWALPSLAQQAHVGSLTGNAASGKKSFAAVLDEYRKTLIGAKSTVEDKNVIIDKVKSTLFGAETLPLCELKPSQIKAWLATHYGHKSASYYNSALMLIRDALETAVRDRVIAENPAKDLKYRKRKTPIRLTPSWQEFKAIVAEIREDAASAA